MVGGPASELTQFLRSHDRTLLLLWRVNDIESIRWVVPPGWELRKVADMATATVALIQVVAPSSRPHAGVGTR